MEIHHTPSTNDMPSHRHDDHPPLSLQLIVSFALLSITYTPTPNLGPYGDSLGQNSYKQLVSLSPYQHSLASLLPVHSKPQREKLSTCVPSASCSWSSLSASAEHVPGIPHWHLARCAAPARPSTWTATSACAPPMARSEPAVGRSAATPSAVLMARRRPSGTLRAPA